MIEITQEKLKELFIYDPVSGLVVRKKTTSSNAKAGSVVGSINSNGYLLTKVCGKSLAIHRIVWIYVHGITPQNEIDHVNGDKTDNRIENLRICSKTENQQNQKLHSDNTSGYHGVSWRKDIGKWRAQIQVAGKKLMLGCFDNLPEAIEAHTKAKEKYHCFQPFVRS